MTGEGLQCRRALVVVGALQVVGHGLGGAVNENDLPVGEVT